MAVLTLNSLPLGYRFRLTDEELLDYYLRNKINGNDNDVQAIFEIDVCKLEPWDLPVLSVVQSKDLERFFFCPRDQKYPSGSRSNRATAAGYWKSTGNDRKIKNQANVIGMKKTLVFYEGHAPNGKRTNWVMQEYRPTLAELDGTHPGQNAFVLCRLFKILDESVKNSHCDEVELAHSSPTATNSSPGYTQSEQPLDQENSALGSQVEKQPTNSESFQAEDFESSSDIIMVPIECHNHSGIADDHTAAVTLTEVQVEYGDRVSDPILYLEDCTLFSPLPSQMRAELGSFDMHHPLPIDFSNGHSGLQFQYCTNEQGAHISEFVHSILNNNSEDDDKTPNEDLGTRHILEVDNETLKFIHTISQYQDSVKDNRSSNESDRILLYEQEGGKDSVKDLRSSDESDQGLVLAQWGGEVSSHISELLNSICYETEDDYFCGDLGIRNILAAFNETPKYINTISPYQDSVKDSRSCGESDQIVAYEEGGGILSSPISELLVQSLMTLKMITFAGILALKTFWLLTTKP